MKKVVSLLITFYICTAHLLAHKEVGSASYYNHRFHGRKTASGELYDKQKYSCAHRSLPFGTLLQVKNLNNGKSVQVVVNDRGPYHSKRIVDLSYQAARAIDLIQAGVAPVQVEVVQSIPIGLPPWPFQLQFIINCWQDVVSPTPVQLQCIQEVKLNG